MRHWSPYWSVSIWFLFCLFILIILCSLLQQLSHDLRITLAPLFNEILHPLLNLLPRSLSAPTLTVLLETFSSFIKYVIIPLDAVEDTWRAFQPVFTRCNPEVQRAVAELWGMILRRLKLPVRERCSVLMTEETSVDVSAWIFVAACKVRCSQHQWASAHQNP